MCVYSDAGTWAASNGGFAPGRPQATSAQASCALRPAKAVGTLKIAVPGSHKRSGRWRGSQSRSGGGAGGKGGLSQPPRRGVECPAHQGWAAVCRVRAAIQLEGRRAVSLSSIRVGGFCPVADPGRQQAHNGDCPSFGREGSRPKKFVGPASNFVDSCGAREKSRRDSAAPPVDDPMVVGGMLKKPWDQAVADGPNSEMRSSLGRPLGNFGRVLHRSGTPPMDSPTLTAPHQPAGQPSCNRCRSWPRVWVRRNRPRPPAKKVLSAVSLAPFRRATPATNVLVGRR